MDFSTEDRADKIQNQVEDEYMDMDKEDQYDMVPLQGMCPMMNHPCMQGMMGMPYGIEGGNIGMMPENMGMMPQNMSMISPNMGIIPQSMGMMPPNMGMMPSNMGMAPQNMGMMPSNIGMMPEMMDNEMDMEEIMSENMHGMNMMNKEEYLSNVDKDLQGKSRTREHDQNDVNKIVSRIERYNPGIFASLRRCGFSYQMAKRYVGRIVRLTLMYYED